MNEKRRSVSACSRLFQGIPGSGGFGNELPAVKSHPASDVVRPMLLQPLLLSLPWCELGGRGGLAPRIGTRSAESNRQRHVGPHRV